VRRSPSFTSLVSGRNPIASGLLPVDLADHVATLDAASRPRCHRHSRHDHAVGGAEAELARHVGVIGRTSMPAPISFRAGRWGPCLALVRRSPILT